MSKFKNKCIILAMVITTLSVATACGKTEEQTADPVQTQQTEEQTKDKQSKSNTEIAANTSEKVDAIALEAKAATKESITDEERDDAINFIVEHYPDYYVDNEVMEQTMFYGFWLDYAYKDDVSNEDYAKLGTDVAQAVKYVYRGAEKVEDEATQLNLEQVQKGLDTLGYDVK